MTDRKPQPQDEDYIYFERSEGGVISYRGEEE